MNIIGQSCEAEDNKKTVKNQCTNSKRAAELMVAFQEFLLKYSGRQRAGLKKLGRNSFVQQG